MSGDQATDVLWVALAIGLVYLAINGRLLAAWNVLWSPGFSGGPPGGGGGGGGGGSGFN